MQAVGGFFRWRETGRCAGSVAVTTRRSVQGVQATNMPQAAWSRSPERYQKEFQDRGAGEAFGT